MQKVKNKSSVNTIIKCGRPLLTLTSRSSVAPGKSDRQHAWRANSVRRKETKPERQEKQSYTIKKINTTERHKTMPTITETKQKRLNLTTRTQAKRRGRARRQTRPQG